MSIATHIQPPKNPAAPAQQVAEMAPAATHPDHRPASAAQQHLLADIGSSARVQQATALQRAIDSSARQQAAGPRPASQTDLPDQPKAGVESLSGHSLDDVQVHYNSAQPAQLQAHAYAQGTDIHVAPGQEKHLPHEAWHVGQQPQGRVRPTRQLKGKGRLNDDRGLEKEADAMGLAALTQGSRGEPSLQTGAGASQPPSASSPVSVVQPKAVTGSLAGVVQRLVGAAAPIAGHDAVLPGTAANRGAAAEKIAKYINLRARETAAAGVGVAAQHENTSALGAHNAGNVYVRSDYTTQQGQAATLEAWSELTGVGGGYVKRIRIRENNALVMDRVMNDPAPTALNTALHTNAAIGAGGAAGLRQYGSVHEVDGSDNESLRFTNTTERDADNLTKVIGEGARFAWLATALSKRKKGNASRGVFNVTIKIAQAGTFTIDPTFEQLWGAWASAFGRSYMKDKGAAKALLRQRLEARLRPARDNDAVGAAPLASGATAAGQVTSLLGSAGRIMLMPTIEGGVSAADIIADLRMTWTADH